MTRRARLFLRAFSPQSGVTLVELMVAVVLGLFLVGVIMTVFMTTFAANSDNLKTTRLNQELRAIMDLVSGDLRRQGHWGFAANALASAINEPLILNVMDQVDAPVPTILTDLGMKADGLKFYAILGGNGYRGTLNTMDGMNFSVIINGSDAPPPPLTLEASRWGLVSDAFNSVILDDLTGDGNDDCVLYAADLNGDGLLNTGVMAGEPDERLGLRYDAGGLAIERRQTGTNCMGANWVNLNDERSVEITAFQIEERLVTSNIAVEPTTMPPTPEVQLEVREFEVRLSGRLVGSPEVQRELVQIVNPRNDRIAVL